MLPHAINGDYSPYIPELLNLKVFTEFIEYFPSNRVERLHRPVVVMNPSSFTDAHTLARGTRQESV